MIEQIKEADAKVKSGADFLRLAQNLIDLGVKTNDVYVRNGRAEYFGAKDYIVKSGTIYPTFESAVFHIDSANFRKSSKQIKM